MEQKIEGEVAGSFLLGLRQSFANMNVLPQGGLNMNVGEIDPIQWYPYSMLIKILEEIQASFPSHKSIFFRAGINFLRIWYEEGPGKEMIHSGIDWLYANSDSQGYNSVVRGNNKDEIGWCLLKHIDEEAGIAVYENVMPLSPDYVRGVFYGGCMIFDDMEYFNVEIQNETYPENPLFFKFTLTVLFRMKTKKHQTDLYQKVKNLPHGSSLNLSSLEVEGLVWAFRHLINKNEHDTAYSQDINRILSDAINISEKNAKELEKANIEISFQKKQLSEKQKEILDSIYYAKKIQEALLTNEDFLLDNNLSHFILFKPKDIVSGDFIWTIKKDNLLYLACCDSTGHGVPGAFMSLLNIGFLNEAISEVNISEPGKIFNYVRKRLIETIGKDTKQKDGFDGILLCIDSKKQSITYTAANNKAVIVRDNKLIHLLYNKMPVGEGPKQDSFETFTITYKTNDKLYLFTDGYSDQFGGAAGKKFKHKAFEELLLTISNKEAQQQHDVLDKTIDKWRGNLDQVDDICVFGVFF